MKATVFIVKGGPITQEQIDEIDSWPQEALGKTEWQFSDALSGERGMSADFHDLTEGVNHFTKDTVFNIDEADFTDEEYEAFVATGAKFQLQPARC